MILENPSVDKKVIQEEVKSGFAPLVLWTVSLKSKPDIGWSCLFSTLQWQKNISPNTRMCLTRTSITIKRLYEDHMFHGSESESEIL